ncbi:conserved hypothetical protein [Pseudomonas sp. 8Z]|uniref:hypothetical protein n=1 Tax=Pseudomonas sp. 8Z TaxID=2653166 RepID=UPI0012F3FBE2|nr:hypothetical protein [Pseudomonas sp. 8Z]VXC41557.1 conserved hypothetical protein [Pseudomonas sp. 8Z]
MTISESDWKIFKELKTKALERFSQRILDESQAICCNSALSAHERYGELYRLIHQRDKEMARAFDGLSRSKAHLQLCLMQDLELLTQEELARFSKDFC